MTCPTKRPGSSNWQFKRRIPKDVQTILAGLPKDQWPKNWYAGQIVISLGTADKAQAKAKCPDVAADVEKRLAALRAGPKPLTRKQVSALSGKLYEAFSSTLEDNPGSADLWQRVADMNRQADAGEYGLGAKLGIFPIEGDRRDAAMEARFGGLVDALLTRHAVFTTPDSRWAVIEQVARDSTALAQKLMRNADGDYTPDTYPDRFAPLDLSAKADKGRSLTALLDAWSKAAPARGVVKRDVTRIRARFQKLIEFLEHDDIARVTRLDIVRWIDHRLAEGKTTKTINDSDIASFSNVFRWGKDRDWLAVIPTEGTAIRTKRKPAITREKYFTPDEAVRILKHAAAVTGSAREHFKTTAAKRWVPWLLAYSGARIVEMVQIRKQDMRNDPQHGWVLRISPDAGNMKKNVYCDVPLHEHLIAEGFMDFVTAAPRGHLFCEPDADGSVDGSAQGIYSRIRNLIREVVTDKAVQPNHGWRYTFKTYGQEAGISEYTLNAISNHAARSEGENYMKVTLRARREAMTRYPRWRIT